MITKLILLNGPPGVGKSTLARRYVDDHPLTLHLEIDAIRMSLGRWQDFDETKLIARTLATAMAQAQLQAGHDVILAQYLGHTEFIEALDQLAQHLLVDFLEILLLDTETAAGDRFRARRVELASTGQPHPETDVNELSVAEAIAESLQRLKAVQTERTTTHLISATGGLEEAYRALCRALGDDCWSSP